MKLEVIGLKVRNWKKMVSWYQQKLGLKIVVSEKEGQFAMLHGSGGAILALWQAKTVTTTGNFTPHFRVRKIEGVVREFRRRLVNVGPIESQHWGKQVTITDPEGNKSILYEEK